MKWFRFYNEFRSDTKMKRMPIPHRYAFIMLLCLASEGDDRGQISGLDDDDLAFELEMSTEDWLTLKAKFKAKGFIDFNGDTITIANWNKRQFESDSSAARVEKHRAKEKEKNCNVTKKESNVTKPLAKQHVTARARPDPYSESDPEADSDLSQDPDLENDLENFEPEPENERENFNASLPKPEVEPNTTHAVQTLQGLQPQRVATHETDRSAAANFSEKEKPRDPMGDRLRSGNSLPGWRVSHNPNGWNEEILTEYMRWADGKFKDSSHTRFDAVSFFSKCEKEAREGGLETSERAIAMLEVLQQRLVDRASRRTETEAARSAPLTASPSQKPESIDPEVNRQGMLRARAAISQQMQLRRAS